ncbi:phage tail protein [uncultured Cohaesibacter sp.]|uniref:phage tail protein n=1 Tax=uncultured Cohaesibacter sp. TaxID=1002546 RepID=UPI002AAB21AA|nr:phage tail protein [uncultured Cohaesibacter sp.]
MTDQNTKRGIPLKAIPPGINDDRTRTFVRAFNAMADRLDFTSLLMRTGDETSDEALPLAAHDRSLEEFLPPDGLPPEATRRLIDSAWELHERKGTDGGVILGQSLLGIQPHITQWYEQEPVGHHDTHQVTVYVNEHLYADEAMLLNEKIQRASLKMIDATKRWSQESSFALGVGLETEIGFSASGRAVGLAKAEGEMKLPTMGSAAGLGISGRALGFVARDGEAKLPSMGAGFALGAQGRAIMFLQISGELQ